MIEILRAVVILLGFFLIIGPVVSGDGTIDVNMENNNPDFKSFMLMLFAFIGWSFVLVLIGGGIYHAFRHHRNRKEPERPLRCK